MANIPEKRTMIAAKKSKKKHVGFVSNKKKTSITLVQIICILLFNNKQ
jgi:hypothetical protein